MEKSLDIFNIMVGISASTAATDQELSKVNITKNSLRTTLASKILKYIIQVGV